MLDPGNFLPYYVRSLSRSLQTLGATVRVISSPPLFEAVEADVPSSIDIFFFPFLRGFLRDGLRYRRVPRQAVKALAYPFGLFRTWRALRKGVPGILHAQWAPIPILDGLLFRLLRSIGWRIVFTAHDPAPTTPIMRVANAWVLAATDAVIVHTSDQKAKLTADFPRLANRVHIISHGGTVHTLVTAAEKRRERQFLGIADDRPILLFFGLIKPYKGLAYLLEAMPAVIERYPSVLLVIAGEALMPLSPFRKQIHTLGLEENVSLRPGFVPESTVPAYMRAADLLVTPYVSVGASGVLVLAQGHGLPVVVTRVGGLPDFVERDRGGFVVPACAPIPLADAICRGLDNRDELAAMGRRGWLRLARENRWSDIAGQTLALYARTHPAPSPGKGVSRQIVVSTR